MKITSIFKHKEEIPKPYTCLGANISPPLQFLNLPRGTESLVLIFEDTDATPKPWTHWMVFNIPAATLGAEEGTIPAGGIEGLANNHSFGYEGPCPKYFKGVHRYSFKLYALDKMLDLPAASEREAVEECMKGHVLATATLSGFVVPAPENNSLYYLLYSPVYITLFNYD